MTKATPETIEVIRRTAVKLKENRTYSWLHLNERMSEMLALGVDPSDLKNLERLSDVKILESLPPDDRNLDHEKREDVIKYLYAWATLLENELLKEIDLPASIYMRDTIL